MIIESSPPAYSSVNGNPIWVVSDTDTTGTNYKYVADVYINAALVFRSKVYPTPSGFGVFNDLGEIIRAYCNAAFKDLQTANEFYISVTVKFGEEYGGTLYADLATSTLTMFNHYNGRTSTFTDLATYADKPATNRGNVIEIPQGCTTYYLPYYANTTGMFTTVINGTSTNYTPAVANTMYRLNIADPAATANYDAVIDGVTYKVKVICTGLYKNYYLHFLNKWGGWETMLFNKVSRRKLNIERKAYQQQAYRVSGAGVVSLQDNNIMHKQRTTFGVTFSEALKISTDWIEDADYQWLGQLICSPDIYLQDGTIFYPVGIANTDYEFKEHIVDELTNINIDLEMPTKYNTQFA